MLKNVHDETGNDLVVLTLNTLAENERFEDIEKQIHSKYLFGGKRSENWAIIIVTQSPYQMNIKVGKGLRRIISPKTIRVMMIEFFFNRGSINNNNVAVDRWRIEDNLYSTALFLAELIADSQNKRLHTTERTINENITYYANGRTYVEPAYGVVIPETYIPQTRPFQKFVRRNNLYPALIILGLGLFPLRFVFGGRRNCRIR